MGSIPIGISGSRAAAILGMSPWSTPFKVWQDIMEKRQPGFNAARGYDYEPFEGNAATRWGLAFEDAVIKLCEEHGHNGNHHITDREREFSHPNVEYVTCHIDGMYQFNPRILHEGKTTTSYGFGDKWGEPGTDRIPIEYMIQVQHQMLCTGADEAIVSVLVFPKRPEEWEEMGITAGGASNEEHGKLIRQADATYVPVMWWAYSLSQMGFFHQYVVKADPDLHALMLDKYRVWWTKYVIGETPPAPANYADIRAMITAPVGTIIVDPDTARWFKEFKDIGGEIGATGNLAKRRDQLKTLILDRGYRREYEMCPIDKMFNYSICKGECEQSECSIGNHKPVVDDESVDKWVFRDDRGRKLGSYGKNAKGSMIFR